jgi:hypothetical protein
VPQVDFEHNRTFGEQVVLRFDAHHLPLAAALFHSAGTSWDNALT